MKTSTIFIIILFFVAIFGLLIFWAGIGAKRQELLDALQPAPKQEEKKGTLKLESPAFQNGAAIPARFTCAGANVSPPLAIIGAPAGTKAYALVMDDPDAPSGTWTHWIKWNISPLVRTIEEGVEPAGVSGRGRGGNETYQGPCPPSGAHSYRFRLYALDASLPLKQGSSKAALETAMMGHVLEQAELVGTFSK